MLHIGCHLSSSKGFESMGKTAVTIGADTFQYFTRNPRGSRAKPIDMEDIKRLRSIMSENNFPCILGHASYTMNPCSSKENLRVFAADIMKEDLIRMENIPGQYYNFHPGSHTKQGIEKGIEQIIICLNKVITEEQTTTILIETMPGKGTEVGSCFEELAAIIDGVEYKEKLGVCFDTCHVHDAGYDIVNNLQAVIEKFDETIGLDYLKAVHLNDSKNICGSHKDRHERIGKGEIGLNAITEIITHPIFKDIPFYLETPNDLKGYQDEIELLKKQYCTIL